MRMWPKKRPPFGVKCRLLIHRYSIVYIGVYSIYSYVCAYIRSMQINIHIMHISMCVYIYIPFVA